MSVSNFCVTDATRQLVWWAIMRTACCALFFFTAIVVESQSPFPFPPDYHQAAVFTAVATPLAGLVLAGRAWLFLQQLPAEQAGMTFFCWLGRRFGAYWHLRRFGEIGLGDYDRRASPGPASPGPRTETQSGPVFSRWAGCGSGTGPRSRITRLDQSALQTGTRRKNRRDIPFTRRFIATPRNDRGHRRRRASH